MKKQIFHVTHDCSLHIKMAIRTDVQYCPIHGDSSGGNKRVVKNNRAAPWRCYLRSSRSCKINGVILQKQFEKLLLLQIFWDTAFEVVSN